MSVDPLHFVRVRFALLGATYTLNCFPRTPEEIVESLFRTSCNRTQRNLKKPKPQYKRVRASLARCNSGTSQPAFEKIFGWMKHEVSVRNPCNEKQLIILMDGQETLWQAAKKYLPHKSTIQILDLLHVTPRLWKAANIFCSEDDETTLSFIKNLVLKILQGKTLDVIQELRQMGIHHNLKGKKKEKVEKICHYFEKNQHRMHYDEYLAAGYPIATGVIEGACRHLVKDRMERAGMRWVLNRSSGNVTCKEYIYKRFVERVSSISHKEGN